MMEPKGLGLGSSELELGIAGGGLDVSEPELLELTGSWSWRGG